MLTVIDRPDLLYVSDRLRLVALQTETYGGHNDVIKEDDKGGGALTKEFLT